MHISEGVLSSEILITGAITGGVLVAFAMKYAKAQQIPKISALSAVFFIASFIHVPIGVTSIHLILSGIVGAFLGFEAILAIFVALFLQGLLFGYGGITTLGVNTLIMGLPALMGRYLLLLEASSKPMRNLLDFSVGFVPIFLSALLLSLTLALNGDEFLPIAYLSFISNLPIMIIEGIISLFAIKFVKNVSPQLLGE